MAISSFILLVPWTYRNYKVYNSFLPVATGSAEMLWFGTLPWEEQRLFGNAPSFEKFREIKDPIFLEKLFRKEARENILNHPFRYLKLCLKKASFFIFYPVGKNLVERRFPFLGNLIYLCHIALIFLAMMGIYYSSSLWKMLLPIYAILAYFLFVHTLLAPEPRYRLPIEPYLLIFAVASCIYFYSSVRKDSLPS